MSNNESKTWLIPTWLKVVVGVAIVVAIVLIGLYFWKFHNGLAETQDVWGQFGDYVGGILNPLFSLTALIALLYTIHLQSKELHESTEQLKASAEALALQNNVLLKQQFETTFFQMLGLFNEVVREVELDFGSKSFKGRLGIFKLLEGLIDPIKGIKNETITKSQCRTFFNKYDYLLGHYFRTLYSIIKFVDKSNLEDENKKIYTNIVRAQLSEHELGLLFYNCIYLDEAQEKFLPLVKKYQLLKYAHKNLLANPAHRELLGV